jgi:hypothetical protein
LIQENNNSDVTRSQDLSQWLKKAKQNINQGIRIYDGFAPGLYEYLEPKGDRVSLIGVSDVMLLIELALYSGYIRQERSVNLLIIANPESGKSEMLLAFKNNRGVKVPTDITAYKILEQYGDAMSSGDIKHLIIPDLITPVSKKQETAMQFVGFLNALIEEGIVDYQSYLIERHYANRPARVGLLTSITPKYLTDKRHRLIHAGFMSRMLPVCYSYSEATAGRIRQYLASRGYRQEEGGITLQLPEDLRDVQLPLPMTERIIERASVLGQATETYGFRYQRQLQVLAMANALKNNRDTVNQEDVDTILRLTYLMDMNNPARL